jgi:hypothetical protein
MKAEMKKKPTWIDARPVKDEVLTARQFVKLTTTQKRNIAHTTMLPAKLGSAEFAGFRVQYKTPAYKAG